jgi:hypothetical protein
MLAVSVSAAVTVVDGNAKFDADYGNFNDEDQDTIAEDGQFQILNSGDVDETITVKVENLLPGYSAKAIGDVTVTAGATQSVSFTINVPHKNDGGEKKIGEIVLSNLTGNELTRVNLIQDTKSMLRLKDLEVRYINEDGKSEKEDIDEKDEEHTLADNVKPGSDFSIKIELENLFDRDYKRKNTLEQITVTIELSDDELFEEDVDGDEFDISDIDADESDKLTLEFTLNEDVDEDEYEIDLIFEAEDEEGSKYKIEKNIKFEVRREKDDVRFSRLETAPSIITACDASFNVDVQLKNFGTRDQNAVRFSLINTQLGISKIENKIVLRDFSDDDNDFSNSYNFRIPSGKEPGTYPLEARAFIKDDDLIYQQTLNVVLTSCRSGRTTQPSPVEKTDTKNESDDSTTGQQPAAPAPAATTGTSNNGVVRTVEDPYTMQDVIMGIIIVAIVLIMVLIIALIVKLLK